MSNARSILDLLTRIGLSIDLWDRDQARVTTGVGVSIVGSIHQTCVIA
jgi:hypothetical protein